MSSLRRARSDLLGMVTVLSRCELELAQCHTTLRTVRNTIQEEVASVYGDVTPVEIVPHRPVRIAEMLKLKGFKQGSLQAKVVLLLREHPSDLYDEEIFEAVTAAGWTTSSPDQRKYMMKKLRGMAENGTVLYDKENRLYLPKED